MRLLNLSLPSPQENVALDEALLDEAEEAGGPHETLRIWESSQAMVVVGRGSRVDQEVERARCDWDQVPILRRCSGGAAIVAGPGCLMYAVILSYRKHPQLRMVDVAHRFVLEQLKAALQHLAPGIDLRGTSDLAVGDRKVSGNSVRCRREHLLYHGTILYDFSLPLVAHYLKRPPRQPDYRQERDHLSFVANLSIPCDALRRAIIEQWSPLDTTHDWPRQRVERLIAEKYSQSAWNDRHR
jgi:lipoate-protein ligase A